MKGFNKILAATGLFALSGAVALPGLVAAQDYQTEVMGGYATIDQGAIDSSLFSVDGTYYLERVSTQRVPLSEAAFLSQVSSLSVGYARTETDTTLGRDLEGDLFGFSGRIVMPEGVIVGGGLTTGEVDVTTTREVDLDAFSFLLGAYLNENSSVEGVFSRSSIGDFDTDTFGARFKTVQPHQGESSYGLAAGLYRSEDDSDEDAVTIDLDADYFPTQMVALGVGLEIVSADSAFDEGEAFEFSIEAFIDPMIALGASFETFSPEAGNDVDTFAFWGKIRM